MNWVDLYARRGLVASSGVNENQSWSPSLPGVTNVVRRKLKPHHAHGPCRLQWRLSGTDEAIDLEIQYGSRGCRYTCSYKISLTWMQRFMSCRANKLFALSRNGEKCDNPVLWPRPLTYDLEILWVLCGGQGTGSCKVSSS